MVMKNAFTLTLLLFVCFYSAVSQNAVSISSIDAHPTFNNIGVHMTISGDDNLNSALVIFYKEQSQSVYQEAAMTMRAYPGLVIDGNTTARNFHAGSVMYLDPGTTYDIQLVLSDPDGGDVTTDIVVSTQTIPTPNLANTRYVSPGNGGGSGTLADPYLGLQAAADNAVAGDHFIVGPGVYAPFELLSSGTAGNPISFISEVEHEATIDGANISAGIIILGEFSSSITQVIIDGFRIQNGLRGIDAQNAQNITVRNNIIKDVDYAYVNRRENGLESDQYITNNFMMGRSPWPANGIPDERAVDLRGTNNVVSFNTIINFADGVSTDGPAYETSYGLDIHNNDIINIVDDHIEVDGTISNTRIYANRCFNARAGISVAPVYGGPVYILRNIIFNIENTAIKMNRGPSGILVAHNTIVADNNATESPTGWQNTYYRNNLILASRYCFEMFGIVNGSIDDWDYGAYYSTRGGMVGTEWFKWNNIRYAMVPDLAASGILEENAIEVAFGEFENIALPDPYPVEYATEDRNFMPLAGASVINSGEDLGHINAPFVSDGQADRGALEFGEDLPQYGHDFVSGTDPCPVINDVSTVSIDPYPTFNNIGIHYSILGDDNLNSSLTLFYKLSSETSFQEAAMTMRAYPGLIIDGASTNRNYHAGSLLSLEPGTSYDVQLVLTDPDGGSVTTEITVATKAIPEPSMNNTYYVAPGNGGGNGTNADPYLGLQEAADNAVPGDHFLVQPGNYSSFNLTTSGTAGNPISFQSVDLHQAIIDGNNTSSGIVILGQFSANLSHVILDGFTIQNGLRGIDAQNTQFITVRNNIIKDVDYAYVNRREFGVESDQYITNNLILGRSIWPSSGIPDERAIDLRGNTNVVSYNTIKNFADGVSTDGPAYETSYALDIHNNDIINIIDDHIEVDGTISNTRIYQNRCFNGRAGVSIAPVYGGPVYVYRNIIFNIENTGIKMNRDPSGIVVAHNTIVADNNATESPTGWQNTYYRNNLILASRYCFEMFGLADDSVDDWDYGAYYSTRGGMVGTEWFKWDNVRYPMVPDLAASGILEANAIEVAFSEFENIALPAPYPTEYTTDDRSFMPISGAAVIDSGEDLTHMNLAFVSDGSADRGALEFGEELPHYGHYFPCDDGDECTSDDNIDIDCNCVGIEEDVDDDGLCDALDPCVFCADLTITQTILPTLVNGPTNSFWEIQIHEQTGFDTKGTITIILQKDQRLNIDWQASISQIGPFSVDNADWNYDNSHPGFHFWTTDIVIEGNGSSTIGFEAVYDPENSSGVVNFTTTILLGSGGEDNGLNNIDSETILYFSE